MQPCAAPRAALHVRAEARLAHPVKQLFCVGGGNVSSANQRAVSAHVARPRGLDELVWQTRTRAVANKKRRFATQTKRFRAVRTLLLKTVGGNVGRKGIASRAARINASALCRLLDFAYAQGSATRGAKGVRARQYS